MRRIHVLPVLGGWGVREMSDRQAFWYDLQHFGLRVALFNLGVLWGLWPPTRA